VNYLTCSPLWAGEFCVDPTESGVSIKPYNMTIDEPIEFRKAIDGWRIRESCQR